MLGASSLQHSQGLGARLPKFMPNMTYCKEWASIEVNGSLPSDKFLTTYMVVLTLCALIFVATMRALHPKHVRQLLRDAGVAMHKVAKTAQEIDRKIFHLCGLLVPLIYQILLQCKYSKSFCVSICWTITGLGCLADLLRVSSPFVQRNWPMKGILRKGEIDHLCGGSYFALGCTISIHFFAPVIAMTSIIFLVLGDMSAALIGRSFGGTICSIKIGPEGKKSVEGSAAMFLICFVFGCTIFSQVHLREYAVFVAALTATLAELYEPGGINDNVSIPVLTSLALTFGFERTYSCEPARNPLLWFVNQS